MKVRRSVNAVNPVKPQETNVNVISDKIVELAKIGLVREQQKSYRRCYVLEQKLRAAKADQDLLDAVAKEIGGNDNADRYQQQAKSLCERIEKIEAKAAYLQRLAQEKMEAAQRAREELENYYPHRLPEIQPVPTCS